MTCAGKWEWKHWQTVAKISSFVFAVLRTFSDTSTHSQITIWTMAVGDYRLRDCHLLLLHSECNNKKWSATSGPSSGSKKAEGSPHLIPCNVVYSGVVAWVTVGQQVELRWWTLVATTGNEWPVGVSLKLTMGTGAKEILIYMQFRRTNMSFLPPKQKCWLRKYVLPKDLWWVGRWQCFRHCYMARQAMELGT